MPCSDIADRRTKRKPDPDRKEDRNEQRRAPRLAAGPNLVVPGHQRWRSWAPPTAASSLPSSSPRHPDGGDGLRPPECAVRRRRRRPGMALSRVVQPTNAQPAAPTRASDDTSLARSSAMRRKLASSAAVGEWGEIAVLARHWQLMPWSATDRFSLRANRAGKPGLMASGWPLISIGPPPCPSTCVILVLPTRPLPVSATDRFAERILFSGTNTVHLADERPEIGEVTTRLPEKMPPKACCCAASARCVQVERQLPDCHPSCVRGSGRARPH